MRKALAAIVALVAALAIAGCGGNSTYAFTDVENSGRFSCELGEVYIITDTRTGVQYIAWNDGNRGGICVLVDKDGKPMLEVGAE